MAQPGRQKVGNRLTGAISVPQYVLRLTIVADDGDNDDDDNYDE